MAKKVFIDPEDGKQFTTRKLAKQHMMKQGHKGAIIVEEVETKPTVAKTTSVKSAKKLSDKEKQENNYLVMEKTSLKFILNDYKTSKKYKEKVIYAPKPLEKIIRMYIRKNGDSDNLFPMTRNAISQLLIKTSKKYLDKSISTTMIRKIVASDLLKDVKKKEQELSNKMGTDIDTIKSVYVKRED